MTTQDDPESHSIEIQTKVLHEIVHELQGILLGVRLSFKNLTGKKPDIAEATTIFKASEARFVATLDQMSAILHPKKNSP
jgi:hypothetical protein